MFTQKLGLVPPVLLLITLFVLYGVGVSIYRLFIDPLSRVPGPKLYAITELKYISKLVRGKWPRELKQLHDEYGPVVRYGPKDVSFVTASAWREIYGHKTNGLPHFDKDLRNYRGSLTGTPNILVADDSDHARMRRLLAHAFSEKALRGQEDIMKHHISLFIRQLKGLSAEGREVDMVKWFNFTTFDIIGDLAFGEPFGCLESGGYHPWVAMIFDGFELATYKQALARLPRIRPFLSWMLPQALMKRQIDHFTKSFEKAKKRVESGRTDREDFTSYILRYNDEKGMTSDEIGENANVLIVAGSETTSTLLSGTTYWLLRTPAAYQKLVEEVRSIFKSEGDITLASVNTAKYLVACLTEGLRIYPPVPSGLGRQTPNGGRFVDEFWIPEKTVVSVPHYASYHSEKNFRDPDSFRPERWLDDHEFATDNREVLQPFNYGPRNCLGKNLAYAESRLILAHLLWHFDLEAAEDISDWHNQDVYLFWKKSGLNVKLHPVARE